MTETAALSLGSNLGDKSGQIAEALRRLDAGGARIVGRSSDYRTEPWGNTDQDWFVNAAALVETDLAPEALLGLCLAVERSLGRVREEKWGPRTIDIDILSYGDRVVEGPSLTLPHPFVLERAFVLAPLAEIAPDLVIRDRRVADALADLGTAGIEKLG